MLSYNQNRLLIDNGALAVYEKFRNADDFNYRCKDILMKKSAKDLLKELSRLWLSSGIFSGGTEQLERFTNLVQTRYHSEAFKHAWNCTRQTMVRFLGAFNSSALLEQHPRLFAELF